jgi:ATP-dependent helicase/nuclease subunit B
VLATEVRGELRIDAPAGPFRLSAKADRIDRLAAGLSILDYKTGTVPTNPQVESGLTPQLTLEAAIAQAGGFKDIAPAEVAELAYVRLTGREPPGELRPIGGELAKMAQQASGGLSRLIAAFDDPKTPYRSRPRPMFIARAGDYDHLARVKEWSSGLGEGA